jgi:uroporphyrinogen decarboxylase
MGARRTASSSTSKPFSAVSRPTATIPTRADVGGGLALIQGKTVFGAPADVVGLVRDLRLMLAGLNGFLEAGGDLLDLAAMGDDLGTQTAPLISPKMYRALVKPRHAELFALVKARSPAKVFFHTCGNVYPLIGDLVEAGIGVLNPVQVSAAAMGDTARLKRQFGARLSFCGAIDTHRVLPSGTPAEVREEVRRVIEIMGPGGGYLVSSVHTMMDDVPPENIVAMVDAVEELGRAQR